MQGFNAFRQVTEETQRVTCKHCLGKTRRTNPNAILTENLVGRMLLYSFGYDMRLNEFFIIERQTASTVVAREIGSKKDGGFSGYETPDPSQKRGRVVRFRVRGSGADSNYYFVSGRTYATLHDGSKVMYDELD